MRPRRPSRCGGSGHLESYAVRRARWPFQAVGFGPRGAPESIWPHSSPSTTISKDWSHEDPWRPSPWSRLT
ncbi:Glutathione peroxidase 6 [Manis javanica]|nr:Glutathione peroxidase 6 [Manis javanica]